MVLFVFRTGVPDGAGTHKGRDVGHFPRNPGGEDRPISWHFDNIATPRERADFEAIVNRGKPYPVTTEQWELMGAITCSNEVPIGDVKRKECRECFLPADYFPCPARFAPR